MLLACPIYHSSKRHFGLPDPGPWSLLLILYFLGACVLKLNE